MKVLILFLLALPFVFTGPGQVRLYFPDEKDPYFKRFIYVETKNGTPELIDLTKEGTATPRIEMKDVEYDLYTRSNKDTPFIITHKNNSLSSSNFNPKKISIFICHGLNGNRNSNVNTLIKRAVFDNYDVNLFIVDWSGPASLFYPVAALAVLPIGEIVGQFINSIQDSYNLDGSSFVLIGHSLGAHVAGSAGATVTKKLAHIIGLDPAGPLFFLEFPDGRLDIRDAKFVQIVHTNGNGLGFARAMGHIDHYPNGGMDQPGCGLDWTCSHARAYHYMAEALVRGPVFQGRLCPNWTTFLSGMCNNSELSVMGEIQVPTSTWGEYYLETNAEEPYGQGSGSYRHMNQLLINYTTLAVFLFITTFRMNVLSDFRYNKNT